MEGVNMGTGRIIDIDKELHNADWTKSTWDLLGEKPSDYDADVPAVKFRRKRKKRLSSMQMSAEFEAKHPRAKDGKWSKKGSGKGQAYDEALAKFSDLTDKEEAAQKKYHSLIKDLPRGENSQESIAALKKMYHFRKLRDEAQEKMTAARQADRDAKREAAEEKRKADVAKAKDSDVAKELREDWVQDEELFDAIEMTEEELSALLDAASSYGTDGVLAGVEIDTYDIADNYKHPLHRVAQLQSDAGYNMQGEEYEPGELTVDGGHWEPEEEPDMDTYMRNHYPEGHSWYESGFLLADGTLLDMSHGSGSRADDHRSINPTDEAAERWGWYKEDVFRKLPPGGSANRSTMLAVTLKKANAIRIDGNSGMIHVEGSLTRRQEESIRDYIDFEKPDYVAIDTGWATRTSKSEQLSHPDSDEVIRAIRKIRRMSSLRMSAEFEAEHPRDKSGRWIEKSGLHFATGSDQGVQFETGKPVEFPYVRNTEGAPFFGSKYQQDIEPAGRYLLHNSHPGDQNEGWETGTVRFENPLVIKFNPDNDTSYDEHSWKAQLHRHYGKTGKDLSDAIRDDGFDGIVTIGQGAYAKEIVDLKGKK
jgi:hypothetical protein